MSNASAVILDDTNYDGDSKLIDQVASVSCATYIGFASSEWQDDVEPAPRAPIESRAIHAIP